MIKFYTIYVNVETLVLHKKWIYLDKIYIYDIIRKFFYIIILYKYLAHITSNLIL